MRENYARTPDAECVYCHRHHGQQKYDRQGNPKLKNSGKCDTVVLTINHRDRASYLTKDLYCTWDPARMEIVCVMCNLAFERGQKPCPECLRKEVVTYIKWYDEECIPCYFEKHPEIQAQVTANREAREENKRQYKKTQASKRKAACQSFPCKSRLQNQKCRKGGVCGYSKKNCTGCGKYEARPAQSKK